MGRRVGKKNLPSFSPFALFVWFGLYCVPVSWCFVCSFPSRLVKYPPAVLFQHAHLITCGAFRRLFTEVLYCYGAFIGLLFGFWLQGYLFPEEGELCLLFYTAM